MNEKLGKILSEVYEILLRTLVFLMVSYGVTNIMTADALTGLLWVRMHNIVWGLLLADVGLLIAIPFFSPMVLVDIYISILKYERGFQEWDKSQRTEKTIKENGIPPDDIIRSAERVLGKLLESDVDVVVSSAMKSAYDGLQTAVAMLDDPITTIDFSTPKLDEDEAIELPFDFELHEAKTLPDDSPKTEVIYETGEIDGRVQTVPVLDAETVEEK